MDYIIAKTFALQELLTFKLLLSTIASVLCFFFNELYAVGIIAVAMLMVFDAITGIMASVYEKKEISSQRFARSVKKGIVYFIAISAGHFADQTLAIAAIRFVESTMITFVGATEFISIIENIARMGFAVPKKLLNQVKADFKRKK